MDKILPNVVPAEGAGARPAHDGLKMNGKGKQFVPHGRRVMLSFPGGAGYGKPSERDPEHIRKDLARGYISAKVAKDDYGMSDAVIADILNAVKKGEAV